MKKQLKIWILIFLVFTSTVIAINTSLLRGILLMCFAFTGMFVMEGRQVRRTVSYFEPLLFRCGRLSYVSESIELLKKSLIFKKYYAGKLVYLEAGIHNIQGEYEVALTLGASVKKEKLKKDILLQRELIYSQLKLGEIIEIQESKEPRQQLMYILSLINKGQKDTAQKELLLLRSQEVGNIIFEEIHVLLAMLYEEVSPEEASYYRSIAESFKNDREL